MPPGQSHAVREGLSAPSLSLKFSDQKHTEAAQSRQTSPYSLCIFFPNCVPLPGRFQMTLLTVTTQLNEFKVFTYFYTQHGFTKFTLYKIAYTIDF